MSGGPLYFIEPELAGKRAQVVRARVSKKEDIDQNEIQERLRDMRKFSISNFRKNLGILLEYARVHGKYSLTMVGSPSEVVKYISSWNNKRDTPIRTVALNRSNTVRELLPELTYNGFETIDTYNPLVASGALGNFSEVSPGGHWTLRNFELDNIYSSFDLSQKPLTYSPQVFNDITNGQDFIGVIGANVISCTGKVLIVQHLNNISSILKYAKHTFIVVTLDKLVESFADALFQARCTAMYGLSQILLDLFDHGHDEKDKTGRNKKGKHSAKNNSETSSLSGQSKFDPRPFSLDAVPENLHIILLNDRRSTLVGTEAEDLLYCISCRRCGLHCPRLRAHGKNIGPEDEAGQSTIVPGYTARELLMKGYLAGTGAAVASGLFECTLCRSCSEHCPLGIDLAGHLQTLREQCQDDDSFAEPHKRIRDNILDVGNAYGAEHAKNSKARTRGGT